MPKIKIPKSAPSLDMTPMVDLAFLLVTFFILTANFRKEEAVRIDTPSSTSEKILPENVMMLTIDTGGRVFFDVGGQDVRLETLTNMADKYGVKLTSTDIKRYQVGSAIGVPMNRALEYIRADEKGRTIIDKTTPGIPIDSVSGQLDDWVYFAANARVHFAEKNNIKDNNELRSVVVKADGKANYKVVRHVMQICQDRNLHRFNLITNMETDPTKGAK